MATLQTYLQINHSADETEIFRKIGVNTVVADAMAPCIAISSALTVLTIGSMNDFLSSTRKDLNYMPDLLVNNSR